jgi:hypothetical protein
MPLNEEVFAPAGRALEANVLEHLRGERNCGSKTLAEIQRWMEEETRSVEFVA